ncbi:hypothetical protein [Paenibacillus amylolyticus]|uniref:hypothetical protein n=1 Tax=Paenibacillus amylolyticus TaxID=1451 RepID=UPI0033916638
MKSRRFFACITATIMMHEVLPLRKCGSDGGMSTALMYVVQIQEVLPRWEQHLTLTRLAIAQAASRFTFHKPNNMI